VIGTTSSHSQVCRATCLVTWSFYALRASLLGVQGDLAFLHEMERRFGTVQKEVGTSQLASDTDEFNAARLRS